jgi:uncharacterized membrane protein YsdA (DUF1294 family)
MMLKLIFIWSFVRVFLAWLVLLSTINLCLFIAFWFETTYAIAQKGPNALMWHICAGPLGASIGILVYEIVKHHRNKKRNAAGAD